MTGTQGKTFEDMFLVKIANKGPSLNEPLSKKNGKSRVDKTSWWLETFFISV